jgi:multidrug transporter EmrE-like cation transporter
MPYIYLIIAISTEVIGSAFLKNLQKAFQNLYHPLE